jgi:hypothetical protein
MTPSDALDAGLAIVAAIGVYSLIGYGIWRLAHMKPGPDRFVTEARITRALLKFCVDHRGDASLGPVRDCLQALENGDVHKAIESYDRLHFGSYGFDDWFPPVVFEHEDGDYVWTVFQSLTAMWVTVMQSLRTKYQRR